MTLDEAIKHCEEVAERLENSRKRDWMGEDDERWASQHRQIAEWLKDLKEYKDARVGCEYCRHKFREQHERPCSLCKHNFMDMFEREVNADDE
jgi:hypothetical protein